MAKGFLTFRFFYLLAYFFCKFENNSCMKSFKPFICEEEKSILYSEILIKAGKNDRQK